MTTETKEIWNTLVLTKRKLPRKTYKETLLKNGIP